MRTIGPLFFLLVATLYMPTLAGAANDDRGVKLAAKMGDGRQRVALVIGNSSYKLSPLKNPSKDAWAMAAALRRLGFDVEEKTNLGYVQMNKAIESFGKRLKPGGVGLFYYAGHGIQVNGANYLVPADAEIEDENEVRYKAVDAGLVLAKMEQASGDVNIVILDACRNNPFTRSFRSASRGLASMDAPTGSLIAYATAPGKTAADGTGNNGVYTEELIKVLETPGINVEQAFKRVRKAVLEKTGNAQVPWESSSLVGDFQFVPLSSMTDQEPSSFLPEPVVSQAAASLPVADIFSVNVDTIIEKDGLMWWRDAFYKAKKMKLANALSAVASMNANVVASCRNWRLPHLSDFKRLEKYAREAGYAEKAGTIQFLNRIGFFNVKSDYYWSSDNSLPHTDFSISKAVDMESGYIREMLNGENLIVWPVCEVNKKD